MVLLNKWLTSPSWADGRRPADPWQREFKTALQEHMPRLSELRALSNRFAARIGLKPVPPDLWLLRDNEHWFVEVKLPKDVVSDSQLAGLALIATWSPTVKPLHVGVAYLQEQGVKDHSSPAELQRRFDKYCENVRRLAKAF